MRQYSRQEWTWFSMAVKVSCITSPALDTDAITEKVSELLTWLTMAVSRTEFAAPST